MDCRLAPYAAMVYSVRLWNLVPRVMATLPRVMMFIFWAWPIIPALVLASIWEAMMAIARLVRARPAH